MNISICNVYIHIYVYIEYIVSWPSGFAKLCAAMWSMDLIWCLPLQQDQEAIGIATQPESKAVEIERRLYCLGTDTECTRRRKSMNKPLSSLSELYPFCNLGTFSAISVLQVSANLLFLLDESLTVTKGKVASTPGTAIPNCLFLTFNDRSSWIQRESCIKGRATFCPKSIVRKAKCEMLHFI